MAKVKLVTQQVRERVADTSIAAAREGGDTIRLWENYKDQALLWRSIALLQIPATFVAVLFAFITYTTREVILSVPSKPVPGTYAAQDIPDSEFINVANAYVNLIATYQPATVRRQFETARAMLKEPLLSKFNEEMIASELPAIESSSRTQVFFTDPLKTTVTRSGNEVEVSIVGDRWKVIAGSELPTVSSRFRVRMTTIPRNQINPYGIVIGSVLFKADIRGERPADAETGSLGADK
jgi:hypothetical protein